MAKKEVKKPAKVAKTPAKVEKKAEKKLKVNPKLGPTKKVEKPAPAPAKKVEKPSPVPEQKRETKTIKKSEVTRATTTIKKPVEKPTSKLVKKLKPKKVKEAKFEEKKDLDKLYVYFTIVNSGVADSVVKVFEDMGCSVSFIQNGTGTASEEVKKALHIVDSRKEVVISIIRESRLEDVEKELAAFFLASKRNKGVAFATRMDAIQGVRVYKFLSQTL